MTLGAGTVRIPVDIDARVFWHLSEIAERYDMTAAQYINELAISAGQRPDMDMDPILIRWRRGDTDKQIAAELGLTNLTVATRRRKYGYPANKRKAG